MDTAGENTVSRGRTKQQRTKPYLLLVDTLVSQFACCPDAGWVAPSRAQNTRPARTKARCGPQQGPPETLRRVAGGRFILHV